MWLCDDPRERTHRNRRETEKKTRRLVEAIKAGVNALAIARELTSLDQLGRQQDQRIAELEHSLSRPKALRPDVHGLMTLWREFLDNWEYLQDEERQTLLSLIVDSVHIVEKGKGRLRLILSGSPLYKVGKLNTISAQQAAGKIANPGAWLRCALRRHESYQAPLPPPTHPSERPPVVAVRRIVVAPPAPLPPPTDPTLKRLLAGIRHRSEAKAQ